MMFFPQGLFTSVKLPHGHLRGNAGIAVVQLFYIKYQTTVISLQQSLRCNVEIAVNNNIANSSIVDGRPSLLLMRSPTVGRMRNTVP